MNYLALERFCAYNDDKRAALSRYNTKNGTLYHFYHECLRKEYLGGVTSTELAESFDMSRFAIHCRLRRMGVQLEPHGGNKRPLLTVTQIREIKQSDEPNSVLARLYGYDQSGISDIRRGKRWKSIT